MNFNEILKSFHKKIETDKTIISFIDQIDKTNNDHVFNAFGFLKPTFQDLLKNIKKLEKVKLYKKTIFISLLKENGKEMPFEAYKVKLDGKTICYIAYSEKLEWLMVRSFKDLPEEIFSISFIENQEIISDLLDIKGSYSKVLSDVFYNYFSELLTNFSQRYVTSNTITLLDVKQHNVKQICKTSDPDVLLYPLFVDKHIVFENNFNKINSSSKLYFSEGLLVKENYNSSEQYSVIGSYSYYENRLVLNYLESEKAKE